MRLPPDEPWFRLPDGTPAKFARFVTAFDTHGGTFEPGANLAIIDVGDGLRGIADLDKIRAVGWAGEMVRRWTP